MNNGFGNGMGNNFNGGMMGGFYNQPNYGLSPAIMNQLRTIKQTIPFDDKDRELLASLRKKEGLNLNVSDLDVAKAKCPHRDKDNFTIKEIDGSSMVKCDICGEKFDVSFLKAEQIYDAINVLNTAMQQIKLYGLNLPLEVFSEYAMIIPLMHKVPELYKMAINIFNEISRQPEIQANAGMNYGGNYYGMDAFDALANGNVGPMYNNTGVGYMGGYNPQMAMQSNMAQGQYAYQQQQPMMNQQMGGYQQPMPNQQQMMQQPMMNQQMAYQQPMAQPQGQQLFPTVAPTTNPLAANNTPQAVPQPTMETTSEIKA